MAEIRSSVFLGTGPRTKRAPAETGSIERFRILVVGDFSGRASRGVCDPTSIADRGLVRFDPDEIEAAYRSMAPAIDLPTPWGTRLEVGDIDDFRPEVLRRRVPRFDELADLASALRSGNRADEVRRALGPKPGERPAPSGDSSLLDQALGETEAQAGPDRDAGDLVDKLISEFVSPHVVSAPGAEEAELVREVDRSIGEAMRGLLREPALVALESNWSVADVLLRRLELDERLRVDLCDLTPAELRADADATPEGRASQFDRTIERIATERYATLVLALDPVGDSVESIEHLALLARSGLPILASATSKLATGVSSGGQIDPDDWGGAPEEIEAAWAALRASPFAGRIAVVWPGPLRRQPYGRSSAPVDGLEFEEFDPAEDLSHLPWLGGAVVAAASFGAVWSRGERDRNPLRAARSGGWPVFVLPEVAGGEAVTTAGADFGERGVTQLGGRGLSVLRSVRGTDEIELGSLRSVAASGTPFDGPFGPV